jgi:hypothetical protein
MAIESCTHYKIFLWRKVHRLLGIVFSFAILFIKIITVTKNNPFLNSIKKGLIKEYDKCDSYFSTGSKSLVLNFEGIKIPITPFNPTLITMLKKNARNANNKSEPESAARII